jgi:GT2 family glycosyltransferase
LVSQLIEWTKNFVVRNVPRQSWVYIFLKSLYFGYLRFSLEYRSTQSQKRSEGSYPSNPIRLAQSYSGVTVKPEHSIYEERLLNDLVELDIFVPVFNRYDLVQSLLASLIEERERCKIEGILIRIMVGDDCSNNRTSSRLESFCTEKSIDYYKNTTNEGVVKNANQGFRMTQSPFFLMLNSDVSLPPRFVSRFIRPMLLDAKIGAITALTLSDFFHRTQHPPEGLTWRELDDNLAMKEISVLDACTAISHAILIRRTAINTDYLMDTDFGKGYGEDSDLHYRIVENGFRSVWSLNTLVNHVGGSSFNLDGKRSKHQSLGANLFHQRWGARYNAEILEHESLLKDFVSSRLSELPIYKGRVVWIVSPAINEAIGGLSVTTKLSKNLVASGVELRFVDISTSSSQVVHDSYISCSSRFMRKHAKKDDFVLLIGLGGIRWWLAHKGTIEEVMLGYIFQGPDILIDPSGISDFSNIAHCVDVVFAVSPATHLMARDLFPHSKLVLSSIDSDDAYYSSGNEESEVHAEYDVVLMIRDAWGKGSQIAIALANYLCKQVRVAVVGSGEMANLDPKVEILGELNHANLLRLFRQTGVYVDTSFFEGFGLIPREAADGGCFVFVMPNTGGLDELTNFEGHFSKIVNFWNIPTVAKDIIESLKLQKCSGCDFCLRDADFELSKTVLSYCQSI